MSSKDTFKDGGWIFQRTVGQNRWKIYREASGGCITMTGSAVTTYLRIPWPHRWIKTCFRHVTSAYAASNDSLDITIRIDAGKMAPSYYAEDLLDIDKRHMSKRTDRWGEGFEYESTTWTLLLNTTSGDFVVPVFTVQKLGANE